MNCICCCRSVHMVYCICILYFRSRITKIQYLVSSRGSLITPKRYKPPSPAVVNDMLKRNTHHIDSVYSNSLLYQYTDGIRVTLDKAVNTIRIDNITKILKSNYISSLKGK